MKKYYIKISLLEKNLLEGIDTAVEVSSSTSSLETNNGDEAMKFATILGYTMSGIREFERKIIKKVK